MPSLDRYAAPVQFPMPIDAFWRFPHVPAYRVEYVADHALVQFAPRMSMGRLAITTPAQTTTALATASKELLAPGAISIRPIDVTKAHDALARLFVDSFTRVAPLDTMAATTRRHAADAALRHTVEGGDGAYFPACSFGAYDGKKLVGASMVTILTLRADEWPDAELPGPLHNLTWLYVAPDHQRRGIATSLLQAVATTLGQHGARWLISHFQHDNPPSILFHWRNGFELVPNPSAKC